MRPLVLCVLCLAANAWCSPPSEEWWLNKEKYQQQLIDKTEVVRGKRFEVGTTRWHQSTTSRPKFTGPWTEERFFDYWLLKTPKTERVYIPIQWTGNELIDHMHWRSLNDMYINDLLQNLDRSYKYFTVIQIANAFESTISDWVVPDDINLTVFSTGPTSVGGRVVPIPLLKEELQPQGLEKTHSITFYGDVAAPARSSLYAMYKGDPSFIFMRHQKDWLQGMEQSNFTLAPRGWGHDSFRRWEALQVGTIPIYVFDSQQPWLPYKEVLDWSMLSVNVHIDQINQIPVIIKELDNSGKTSAMQLAIRKWTGCFTYEYMLKYIVHDLETIQ